MKLKALTPILICDDVQESIKFYTGALGFTVHDRMDDVGKSGWAMLQHGSVELMLGSPTYLADGVKVDGRYPQVMFYFYPDDLAALRDSLIAQSHAVGPSPNLLEHRQLRKPVHHY